MYKIIAATYPARNIRAIQDIWCKRFTGTSHFFQKLNEVLDVAVYADVEEPRVVGLVTLVDGIGVDVGGVDLRRVVEARDSVVLIHYPHRALIAEAVAKRKSRVLYL